MVYLKVIYFAYTDSMSVINENKNTVSCESIPPLGILSILLPYNVEFWGRGGINTFYLLDHY